MRRILKFTLSPEVTAIETADSPRVLAVDWQEECLVIWVEAMPGEGVTTRLAAFLTGDPVPRYGEYIGTAQHPTLNGGGPLVMHVYRSVGGG